MDKEEIKKEVEKIRKEASIYGWNEKKVKEESRLLKIWQNMAHYDKNGKSIEPPYL